MTAETVEGILADRSPFCANRRRTWREAQLFDDYVLSRERYKLELIETLARTIGEGPVLEVSGGYGSIGAQLAQRRNSEFYISCDCEHARLLSEKRRGQAQIPEHRYRLLTTVPQEKFELVYCVNTLHTWNSPVPKLGELRGYLRSGGVLVINDLRRDANPFITEYVIREMAADETDKGQHHLSTFLLSLRSSYSASEVALLLEEAGCDRFSLDEDEPMTITAVVRN